jgi:hypothetical protein
MAVVIEDGYLLAMISHGRRGGRWEKKATIT